MPTIGGKRSAEPSSSSDATATSISSSSSMSAHSPSKIQRTVTVPAVRVGASEVDVAMTEASSLALREEIELNDKEAQLFDFLLDVEKQYDCRAVLRVAGGWVRDKLLGRDSDDVDIALDSMTGKQFADLINAYEDDHGHKKHAVGVIKANPEQSKHLETATVQLGDIGWVDFVNLRAETYSDEHRIPEVEFGTPLQDAERRDFTINSLFFNIADRKVEDFTQRGIEDLRNRLIRTPLDPRVTFLDDPLRVLRAVRFASRFDFALDEELKAAAQLDEVKEALTKKVSRERVGKELLGMLTGSAAHPERALKLLHELRLCKCIFLPPQQIAMFQPDGTPFEHAAEDDNIWDRGYAYAATMYEQLVKRTPSGKLTVSAMTEDEQNDLKLRILSAFLLPLADFYAVVGKRQRENLPSLILREALKLRTRDSKEVGSVILANVAALAGHVQPGIAFSRVQVGLLLRETRELWPLCSDVALVKELVVASSTDEQASAVARYAAFADAVKANGLLGVWDMKPLLNGNDLMAELGVKPGRGIKDTLDRILEWQLENPSATRDACLAHFREKLASS